MTNSTLSGYQTSGNGGGLYGYSVIGAVIKNSTFSGNRAPGSGGGLYLWALPTGIGVQLLNITISGNQVGTTGGGLEAENPATATPPSITSTRTPTRTSMWTPTPIPAAILFNPVNFSSKIIYISGRACEPKELNVEVRVAPADLVFSVGLFHRLEKKNGPKVGPWSEGLAMTSEGGGWYELTLYGEDLLGGFQSNDEIWVAIQFVANGKDGQVLARSQIYRQVTLGKCYQ
jgi:hypothetical protein